MVATLGIKHYYQRKNYIMCDHPPVGISACYESNIPNTRQRNR